MGTCCTKVKTMLRQFAQLYKLAPKSSFKRYFCSVKYYAESHEWIVFDKTTNEATIGITDFAQNELGDLVHIEVPSESNYGVSDSFCTLESVKGATRIRPSRRRNA